MVARGERCLVRVGRALAVLAGVVVALLAAAGAMAAVPPDARNVPSEQDFLTRLNDARSSAGLRTLPSSDDLVAVARQHSQNMASQHRLYHDDNLASEVSGWKTLGENVGSGADVASVHDAFMHSQVHRDDILDPSFTDVGIGVVWDGSTLWVTQVFRERSGAQASSPPPAPPPAPAPTSTAPPAPRRALNATPPPAPPRASRATTPPTAVVPAPPPTIAAPAPTTPPTPTTDPALDATPSATPASTLFAAATDAHAQLALGRSQFGGPLPQRIPRVPVPVGIAAALLSLVVAAQGVVVRRLGLA